jgi:hypothetical protein
MAEVISQRRNSPLPLVCIEWFAMIDSSHGAITELCWAHNNRVVLSTQYKKCTIRKSLQTWNGIFWITFANWRNAPISFVMSVRPHGTTRLPLYGFSYNLTFEYFRNSLEDVQKLRYNLAIMTGSSHAAVCNFMMVSGWVILTVTNVSDKHWRKIPKHTLYSIIPPPPKSCRLWDYVEKYGRAGQDTDGNIIRRMRIACCMTKATETRSDVQLLLVFKWQQKLREHASLSRLHVPYLQYLSCLCNTDTVQRRSNRSNTSV